jgi:hypothetical protein
MTAEYGPMYMVPRPRAFSYRSRFEVYGERIVDLMERALQ